MSIQAAYVRHVRVIAKRQSIRYKDANALYWAARDRYINDLRSLGLRSAHVAEIFRISHAMAWSAVKTARARLRRAKRSEEGCFARRRRR